MNEQELIAYIKSKRKNMINDHDNELSSIRQKSLDAYMGEQYGNERDGRSRYVTMEVMEAIEWALPSLLRIFTAGDKIVSFDPVGEEDEDLAKQETEIVNHYLTKGSHEESSNFMAFYEWIKDALMYPVGYCKIYTQQVKKVKTEYYKGLSEVDLIVLEEQGVEFLESDIDPNGFYDVKIRVEIEEPRLCFEASPPEQVLIDSGHNKLTLNGCPAICHKTKRSKTWLLENGYDKEKLELATSDDSESWNDERINRLDTEDEYPDQSLDHEAMKNYWLEEWYIMVDYDGDGIAERRKIDYIGGQVFENIEYEHHPFCALSCIPLTHRHSGLSLADIMRPIQELSTFFRRGINNNIGQIIEPKKYVDENIITADNKTIDQLLDPNSNLVITRRSGGIEPEQHQPVVNEILSAVELLSHEKKIRSGISPDLSLDPATLQQSTMGGFKMALNEASQRIELIARVFAETGIKELMLKAHRELKQNQNKPRWIKIRGKWVNSNPEEWRDRDNVTINTGLGFNDKEKMMMLLMEVLGIQKEALAAGLATPKNIYNTLEGLINASGLKSVEKYFTDPDTVQPREPQPDPMVELSKMNLQIQDQKNQAEHEIKLNEQKLRAAELQAEQSIKARELDNKIYEFNQKLAEFELKREEMMAELEIKRSEADENSKLKRAQTAVHAENARKLDIENDAAEAEILNSLEGLEYIEDES